MPGFVVADYVVFAMSIVISLGIGIYYAFSGGRQKTTSEYLVGNRQLKILPVALSLMVSFESSIMMLGFPAETYVYGIMFWLSNFGFLFANLIAVRLVVPLVHPLKITSVYEYFELRFNVKYVRMFGTILGMLNYVFYMGIVLFGPGIALESVTNFPMWASILSVALAAVIYTSIGGIKAVIWTDVFQSVIMFAGIFAILIKGTMVAGGVANVIDINKKTGRLDVFDFNPDPTVRHTFWNLVVGSCIRMVGLNFNQSTIQRISSTPKRKDANKVLYFAGPAFFITLSLATLEGLVAFAYFYTKRCDPLASKEISNPNQVIPYMVLDMFQNFPGMPGLFMASLFSASLSTMSSGLSSLSALTVQDIVKPHYKNLSDATTTMIAKLSVIVFGAMSVGVSFMVAKIKGPMSQISFSVLSAFGGPMAGLFLYSIFCPWATAKGAFSGGFLGFIFMLWMSMGQNFSKSIIKTPWLELAPTDQCQSMMYTNFTNNYTTKAYTSAYDFTQLPEDLDVTTISSMAPTGPQGIDKMYTLSYQWFGTLGILVTIFIGTVTSLIEGRPDPKSIDVRYMLPFFDQFFPFLPKSLRKRLYCGTRYEKRKAFIKNIDKGYDSYEEEVAIGVKLKPLSNQKDIVRYDGMVLVKDGNNGVTASDEPVVSVEAEKGNDVATFMPSSTTEEENLETTKT